ncbi:hypothetical protein [Glaciecola sp. KUL10]|uniref:hypothetical protein n=1 Tax=Glaciecola sp. (strain KUL10) TaxID=2161813 RepID=UPI000D787C68|nr:hypothetical protein [Glaciecola sp. KUL10]GBL03679.1 hypothetical protein KUL10_09790 [Glaciecola sp. KUL10]
MNLKASVIQKTQAWIEPYTFAQRCYFFALILFIFQIVSFDDLALPGILAFGLIFIGFSGELLEMFQKVWDTTLGKSIFIITYATLANIALAFAALQINLITGIEPSPFIFTLGFTTLVFAPLWIGITSIVFLAIGIIFLNAWILISLLLKVLGFEIKVHWKDKKHAILSLVLRLILLPIMIIGIVAALAPYVTEASGNRVEFVMFGPSSNDNEQGAFTLNVLDEEAAREELQKISARHASVRKLIAEFIFHFEAYPYSSCHKKSHQRSVVIDENAILLIERNPQANYGYDFVVAPCERGFSENNSVSQLIPEGSK